MRPVGPQSDPYYSRFLTQMKKPGFGPTDMKARQDAVNAAVKNLGWGEWLWNLVTFGGVEKKIASAWDKALATRKEMETTQKYEALQTALHQLQAEGKPLTEDLSNRLKDKISSSGFTGSELTKIGSLPKETLEGIAGGKRLAPPKKTELPPPQKKELAQQLEAFGIREEDKIAIDLARLPDSCREEGSQMVLMAHPELKEAVLNEIKVLRTLPRLSPAELPKARYDLARGQAILRNLQSLGKPTELEKVFREVDELEAKKFLQEQGVKVKGSSTANLKEILQLQVKDLEMRVFQATEIPKKIELYEDSLEDLNSGNPIRVDFALNELKNDFGWDIEIVAVPVRDIPQNVLGFIFPKREQFAELEKYQKELELLDFEQIEEIRCSLQNQFKKGSVEYDYIGSLRGQIQEPRELIGRLLGVVDSKELVEKLGKTVAVRGKTLAELVVEREIWNEVQGPDFKAEGAKEAEGIINELRELGLSRQQIADAVKNFLPEEQRKRLLAGSPEKPSISLEELRKFLGPEAFLEKLKEVFSAEPSAISDEVIRRSIAAVLTDQDLVKLNAFLGRRGSIEELRGEVREGIVSLGALRACFGRELYGALLEKGFIAFPFGNRIVYQAVAALGGTDVALFLANILKGKRAQTDGEILFFLTIPIRKVYEALKGVPGEDFALKKALKLNSEQVERLERIQMQYALESLAGELSEPGKYPAASSHQIIELIEKRFPLLVQENKEAWQKAFVEAYHTDASGDAVALVAERALIAAMSGKDQQIYLKGLLEVNGLTEVQVAAFLKERRVEFDQLSPLRKALEVQKIIAPIRQIMHLYGRLSAGQQKEVQDVFEKPQLILTKDPVVQAFFKEVARLPKGKGLSDWQNQHLLELVGSNPSWQKRFAEEGKSIKGCLGEALLQVQRYAAAGLGEKAKNLTFRLERFIRLLDSFSEEERKELRELALKLPLTVEQLFSKVGKRLGALDDAARGARADFARLSPKELHLLFGDDFPIVDAIRKQKLGIAEALKGEKERCYGAVRGDSFAGRAEALFQETKEERANPSFIAGQTEIGKPTRGLMDIPEVSVAGLRDYGSWKAPTVIKVVGRADSLKLPRGFWTAGKSRDAHFSDFLHFLKQRLGPDAYARAAWSMEQTFRRGFKDMMQEPLSETGFELKASPTEVGMHFTIREDGGVDILYAHQLQVTYTSYNGELVPLYKEDAGSSGCNFVLISIGPDGKFTESRFPDPQDVVEFNNEIDGMMNSPPPSESVSLADRMQEEIVERAKATGKKDAEMLKPVMEHFSSGVAERLREQALRGKVEARLCKARSDKAQGEKETLIGECEALLRRDGKSFVEEAHKFLGIPKDQEPFTMEELAGAVSDQGLGVIREVFDEVFPRPVEEVEEALASLADRSEGLSKEALCDLILEEFLVLVPGDPLKWKAAFLENYSPSKTLEENLIGLMSKPNQERYFKGVLVILGDRIEKALGMESGRLVEAVRGQNIDLLVRQNLSEKDVLFRVRQMFPHHIVAQLGAYVDNLKELKLTESQKQDVARFLLQNLEVQMSQHKEIVRRLLEVEEKCSLSNLIPKLLEQIPSKDLLDKLQDLPSPDRMEAILGLDPQEVLNLKGRGFDKALIIGKFPQEQQQALNDAPSLEKALGSNVYLLHLDAVGPLGNRVSEKVDFFESRLGECGFSLPVVASSIIAKMPEGDRHIFAQFLREQKRTEYTLDDIKTCFGLERIQKELSIRFPGDAFLRLVQNKKLFESSPFSKEELSRLLSLLPGLPLEEKERLQALSLTGSALLKELGGKVDLAPLDKAFQDAALRRKGDLKVAAGFYKELLSENARMGVEKILGDYKALSAVDMKAVQEVFAHPYRIGSKSPAVQKLFAEMGELQRNGKSPIERDLQNGLLLETSGLPRSDESGRKLGGALMEVERFAAAGLKGVEEEQLILLGKAFQKLDALSPELKKKLVRIDLGESERILTFEEQLDLLSVCSAMRDVGDLSWDPGALFPEEKEIFHLIGEMNYQMRPDVEEKNREAIWPVLRGWEQFSEGDKSAIIAFAQKKELSAEDKKSPAAKQFMQIARAVREGKILDEEGEIKKEFQNRLPPFLPFAAVVKKVGDPSFLSQVVDPRREKAEISAVEGMGVNLEKDRLGKVHPLWNGDLQGSEVPGISSQRLAVLPDSLRRDYPNDTILTTVKINDKELSFPEGLGANEEGAENLSSFLQAFSGVDDTECAQVSLFLTQTIPNNFAELLTKAIEKETGIQGFLPTPEVHERHIVCKTGHEMSCIYKVSYNMIDDLTGEPMGERECEIEVSLKQEEGDWMYQEATLCNSPLYTERTNAQATSSIDGLIDNLELEGFSFPQIKDAMKPYLPEGVNIDSVKDLQELKQVLGLKKCLSYLKAAFPTQNKEALLVKRIALALALVSPELKQKCFTFFRDGGPIDEELAKFLLEEPFVNEASQRELEIVTWGLFFSKEDLGLLLSMSDHVGYKNELKLYLKLSSMSADDKQKCVNFLNGKDEAAPVADLVELKRYSGVVIDRKNFSEIDLALIDSLRNINRRVVDLGAKVLVEHKGPLATLPQVMSNQQKAKAAECWTPILYEGEEGPQHYPRGFAEEGKGAPSAQLSSFKQAAHLLRKQEPYVLFALSNSYPDAIASYIETETGLKPSIEIKKTRIVKESAARVVVYTSFQVTSSLEKSEPFEAQMVVEDGKCIDWAVTSLESESMAPLDSKSILAGLRQKHSEEAITEGFFGSMELGELRLLASFMQQEKRATQKNLDLNSPYYEDDVEAIERIENAEHFLEQYIQDQIAKKPLQQNMVSALANSFSLYELERGCGEGVFSRVLHRMIGVKDRVSPPSTPEKGVKFLDKQLQERERAQRVMDSWTAPQRELVVLAAGKTLKDKIGLVKGELLGKYGSTGVTSHDIVVGEQVFGEYKWIQEALRNPATLDEASLRAKEYGLADSEAVDKKVVECEEKVRFLKEAEALGRWGIGKATADDLKVLQPYVEKWGPEILDGARRAVGLNEFFPVLEPAWGGALTSSVEGLQAALEEDRVTERENKTTSEQLNQSRDFRTHYERSQTPMRVEQGGRTLDFPKGFGGAKNSSPNITKLLGFFKDIDDAGLVEIAQFPMRIQDNFYNLLVEAMGENRDMQGLIPEVSPVGMRIVVGGPGEVDCFCRVSCTVTDPAVSPKQTVPVGEYTIKVSLKNEDGVWKYQAPKLLESDKGEGKALTDVLLDLNQEPKK